LFTVHGPIERDDLPGLSLRVCSLFSGRSGDVVVCDVDGVCPDAVTIEALLRLRLVALRSRCSVRLRNASDDLMGFVGFLGLGDVLTREEF
jgi:hypothetical protein